MLPHDNLRLSQSRATDQRDYDHRLKQYVADRILDKIGDEVVALKKAINELQGRRASLKAGFQVSEAERRASDAEPWCLT